MPQKNIVFCCDGTWDDPNSNSNVCQLYDALDKIDGVQVTGYDSGVGASGNKLEHLIGGALGGGLFQKIKDGYTAIAAQYAAGDQIFLFGFSRGAYTARSLAGMIAICGLPTANVADPKSLSECVDLTFEAYRNAANRDAILAELNATNAMYNAQIQLLGVWDTVGSLGIPAFFGGIDEIQYGFLSPGLHPDVLNAVQAISIDEQRAQFVPAVWPPSTTPGQAITQCWFSGVHCDVGGSYAPDKSGNLLSRATLYWMASYAQAFGLKFKAGAYPPPPTAGDAVALPNYSRTGMYCLCPAHIRNIDADACVSSVTRDRCAKLPGYTPSNLNITAGVLAATYNIVSVPPTAPVPAPVAPLALSR